MRADVTTEARGGRILGLDLLRMLAIVLVFGRHLWDAPAGLARPLRWFFDAWTRGGWVGVDLFFVLSGFLVSGLLFSEYRKKGTISPARFYIRRGWKIYPAFFALIAASMAMKMNPGYEFSAGQIFTELSFMQNYLWPKWNHTWSLAVEEHFYLILPVLLAVLLRLRKGSADPFRPVVALVLASAAALMLARLANALAHPEFSPPIHIFPTHLRLDSLFFGVGIAYVFHFHPAWFRATFAPRRRLLIAGGVAALLPAFAFPLEGNPLLWTAGLTLFGLGSGALLIGVVLTDVPRTRAAVALGLVGTYSYSIYLWHMPVIRWAIPALEKALHRELAFLVRVPLFLVASVALGMLMGRLVEAPALKLRDRWFPTRSGPSPAQSPPATPPRPRFLGLAIRA